jgi:hypothetical protein
MKCAEARALLSSYLDGAVNGKRMGQISDHLTACDACRQEYALLRQVQRSLTSLGRKKAPPDMALRVKVALSRQVARDHHLAWTGLSIRLQNAARAFMWPATAGVLSAVIFFGLLIGYFAVPPRLEAHNDVPTILYTPPELKSSPFGTAIAGFDSESIVVEAFINANGRVQDYRLLSAPKDKQAVLNQLNNLLIFATFRPATAFGQPTSGKAVLSFSIVSVKG